MRSHRPVPVASRAEVPVPSLRGQRDRLGLDVDTDRVPPHDQRRRGDDDRRDGQKGERRGETARGQHHRKEREPGDAANAQRALSPAHRPVVECEPDYRFTLANERTFLAWQRTALGLLAAAVAVVQIVPELTIPGARHVLGVLLAVLASLAAGMGLLRWRQVDRAIRRGNPLPRHPTPAYLAIGLTALGLLTLGLVISEAVTG